MTVAITPEQDPYAFTEEQLELRTVIREFFENRSPEPEVRRLMATAEGFDPMLWAEMARMGLTGLAIPEELGGAGGSLVEVGILMEEAGRALLCAPLMSTVVLATTALLELADHEASQMYLRRIADGRLRATLAFSEQLDSSGLQLRARLDADGRWRLSGTTAFVLDGHSSHLVLVIARSAGGLSVFAASAEAGLTRTPMTTLDLTRKMARIDFEDTPAILLGAEGAGDRVLSRVLDVAVALASAEQVGGAQRVLEMTVDYVKTRQQFGHVIGSFQAVKHKCADMLLRVESAKAAAYQGVQMASCPDDTSSLGASIAKAYCSDAYVFCAAENIHLHGGTGYTWEHPAHLYFRRAKGSAALFGDSRAHRRMIGNHLGI